VDGENEKHQLMHGLDELEARGRMTWIEAQHGWATAPDDVVEALPKDGYEECPREPTSRQDLQPADGAWQGVNSGTGSVASVIWVNQPRRTRALVFIAIDGKSRRDQPFSRLERDPYTDDGGES
jgi:hypothetical protein